jgi:hypothetical protein
MHVGRINAERVCNHQMFVLFVVVVLLIVTHSVFCLLSLFSVLFKRKALIVVRNLLFDAA